jgi:hypothetical protein
VPSAGEGEFGAELRSAGEGEFARPDLVLRRWRRRPPRMSGGG